MHCIHLYSINTFKKLEKRLYSFNFVSENYNASSQHSLPLQLKHLHFILYLVIVEGEVSTETCVISLLFYPLFTAQTIIVQLFIGMPRIQRFSE